MTNKEMQAILYKLDAATKRLVALTQQLKAETDSAVSSLQKAA